MRSSIGVGDTIWVSSTQAVTKNLQGLPIRRIALESERSSCDSRLVTRDLRLVKSKPARERGLVRSEGKEYVVQGGDVMLLRFNV
jgi:hypothetical protein